MKQVVICREDLIDGEGHQVLQKANFEMEGMQVHCALIDVAATEFNAQNPALARYVLIKKIAFTCNYRDKGIILSKAQHFAQDQYMNISYSEQKPFIGIGSDFVGEVIAVGSEVHELAPGDRVINNGSYTDRRHLPDNLKHYTPGLPTNEASNAMNILHCHKLLKIPDGMSDAVASAFTIGGQTSMSMIRRLDIQPGDNVLITAAKSNTSIFALAGLVHRKDINIFVASTNTNHADFLLKQGVKDILLINESPGLFDEASAEKVPIYGFDAVIDPFWDIYLERILSHMAYGGRYITCGLQNQYSKITGKEYKVFDTELKTIINAALIKNISILGNCLGRDADLIAAVEQHMAGNYHIEIDQVFGKKEELSDFFNLTYNRRDRLGKVVFQYTQAG